MTSFSEFQGKIVAADQNLLNSIDDVVKAPVERDILKLLVIVGNLKRLRRTGWVKSGIPDPESVAAHMYRMAVASLVVPGAPDIDKLHCMKMCLVHDMAESLVGDITPHCGISEANKFELESNAMRDLLKLVDPKTSKQLLDLWEEYSDARTPEARFVHDCDKFDMLLQAVEYEADDSTRSLQQFFDSTRGRLETECFKKLVDDLQAIRSARSQPSP